MLYRIQTDMRLDKMKAVTDAIHELVSDFVIVQGRAYSSNTHKPCWIITFEDDSGEELDLAPMITKLKEALGVQEILVRRYPSYKAQV